MAHKTLTRFVVEIGGELKRLFSVREGSKGLLIITTDAPSSVATNQGRISQILSFKHTVHTSERSETRANMIHMTQEFEDGSSKHAHMLTHAVRDDSFAPIYQKLVPDPRNKPSLVPHKKDTIVSLGAFDPDIATLIYGIWLSSAKAAPDFPQSTAYSSIAWPFRTFSLSVAFGFITEPSTVVGTSLFYSTTSADRLTQIERRLGYHVGITPGATADELPAYIVHEMNAVHDLKLNASFQVEMMEQERVAFLRRPMFSASPP